MVLYSHPCHSFMFVGSYFDNPVLFCFLYSKKLKISAVPRFIDYRVRHTLELVADYTVDCSVLNSKVARRVLEDVAKQRYSIIDILCDSGNKV